MGGNSTAERRPKGPGKRSRLWLQGLKPSKPARALRLKPCPPKKRHLAANCERASHRCLLHLLIRAWSVDRRDLGAHRPQIGGELATMMDLIEQESPGHIVAGFPHHFLST